MGREAILMTFSAKTIMIKNTNIVDAANSRIIENQNVIVDGSHIKEISGTTPGSEVFHVVDGEKSYLMPGIADLHVHLNWDGGPDPRQAVLQEGAKVAVLRAYRHALDHLKMGVTTLLDVGSMDDLAIDLASAIRRNVVFGPHLYATGRIICIIGGHGAGLGYEISGRDDALRATRTLIKRGADMIKIAATSGAYGSFGAEKLEAIQLDPEEILTITSEARKYGIKVTAHALNLEGIRNCVDNGVSIIQHGAFLDKSTARLMAQKGVFLVPTLLVYRKLAEGAPGVMPEAVSKAREVVRHHREAFLNALEAGVKIAGGTDVYSPNFGPHPRIIDEAITMGEYGMPNSEVIRAITLNASEALGTHRTRGRVEEGMEADLVLLRGNPLEDLNNLKKVERVFLDGVEIDPHTTRDPLTL
ncbi:hypothetical protein B9Q03_04305 [Candidatus Marsarchaeota G2 archaeon OSP_D]|jgi:Imidazolonepropionase and related amidohydrolases|uniref:Amidohydrolase-related domain-containing protein n=2 Tax=Candidatus Marsarchaeota group 2 TaxID=2203771 RepID=A0A2R6AXD8_9ARCH|nr:MAG: hypothetical protein B9Q08_03590 [Candidatus Marsarchaeota G2 archaeon ECH_B_SAG-M15]PSN91406.1 MAG: hypothetical protein B9Q03_04305 [Candidatus Marsarchaeota G2 archaeon OSP_D]